MLKTNDNEGKIKEGNMKLTSVFENSSEIPSKYTCDGEDAAPELTISQTPEGTKSLALIVDDPDAPMGTWVHWLLYNIPADTTKIDAQNLPEGTRQGMTDFRRMGWGGPCPPSGTHRYFFKLYALSETLELPDGLKKSQLEYAIKDHIIEKAELIGLYKRK
jgi:Raf kinase inhibitor-like protein, YbhB/YbcL family